MYSSIAKIIKNEQLGGSNSDQCYIQNHVVTKHVVKRSRCICILRKHIIIVGENNDAD